MALALEMILTMQGYGGLDDQGVVREVASSLGFQLMWGKVSVAATGAVVDVSVCLRLWNVAVAIRVQVAAGRVEVQFWRCASTGAIVVKNTGAHMVRMTCTSMVKVTGAIVVRSTGAIIGK